MTIRLQPKYNGKQYHSIEDIRVGLNILIKKGGGEACVEKEFTNIMDFLCSLTPDENMRYLYTKENKALWEENKKLEKKVNETTVEGVYKLKKEIHVLKVKLEKVKQENSGLLTEKFKDIMHELNKNKA